MVTINPGDKVIHVSLGVWAVMVSQVPTSEDDDNLVINYVFFCFLLCLIIIIKTKLSSIALCCKSCHFKQQISKFYPLIQHTVIEIQQFNGFQNCSHLLSRIFKKLKF